MNFIVSIRMEILGLKFHLLNKESMKNEVLKIAHFMISTLGTVRTFLTRLQHLEATTTNFMPEKT